MLGNDSARLEPSGRQLNGFLCPYRFFCKLSKNLRDLRPTWWHALIYYGPCPRRFQYPRHPNLKIWNLARGGGVPQFCCNLEYVPGKMMHHFSWFHHFLKPILHFTGASFLYVLRLLFGSPSFYRNIIFMAELCPPNLSPSFYDSALKNFSSVLPFTGSLLWHWN